MVGRCITLAKYVGSILGRVEFLIEFLVISFPGELHLQRDVQMFASGRTLLKCEIAERNFYEIMKTDSSLSYFVVFWKRIFFVSQRGVRVFTKTRFQLSLRTIFENNIRLVNNPD